MAACARSSLSRATFTGNSAPTAGAGVFEDWAPTLLTSLGQPCMVRCTDCSFSGNSAAYGQDVATPPHALGMSAAGSADPSQGQLYTALSGIPFNVSVRLLDFYGTTVTTDGGSHLLVHASLVPKQALLRALSQPGAAGGDACALETTSVPVSQGIAAVPLVLRAPNGNKAGVLGTVIVAFHTYH